MGYTLKVSPHFSQLRNLQYKWKMSFSDISFTILARGARNCGTCVFVQINELQFKVFLKLFLQCEIKLLDFFLILFLLTFTRGANNCEVHGIYTIFCSCNTFHIVTDRQFHPSVYYILSVQSPYAYIYGIVFNLHFKILLKTAINGHFHFKRFQFKVDSLENGKRHIFSPDTLLYL